MPTTKLPLVQLCQTALLAAFIAASGAFKLPGFMPGSEFQLSAPIAVAVCGIFGVKRYLLAGILASAAGFLLGTQTPLNIFIAMSFRITIALIYFICQNKKMFYIVAGPLASIVARLSLSLIIGQAAYPLILAAVPGMLFTSVTAGLIAAALAKTLMITTHSTQRS